MKIILKDAVRGIRAGSRSCLFVSSNFDKPKINFTSHAPVKCNAVPSRCKRKFTRSLKSFAFNTEGNLMTTACFVIPLTALVSMALLELSFAYKTQAKMQTALDASILAASVHASKLPALQEESVRQDTVREEFRKYYNINFGNEFSEDSQFRIDDDDLNFQFNESEGIVTADINFSYDSMAMKFFNLGEMKIAVSGSATYKIKPDNYVIDIVMCIDATGSMATTI